MNRNYLIIGCSGGLGPALVDQLISTKKDIIYGIAPLDINDIPHHERWKDSERYRYTKMDIGQPESADSLNKLVKEFSPEPLVVIFNAAILKQDVTDEGEINSQIFDEIKRVGVDGFNHVVQAVESHLLHHGGILAGISSINAWKPPVLKPKIAYGAAKAYMHMAIRSLRFFWPKKVKLLTFHMGHIGGIHSNGIRSILRPSYADTAKKIIRTLSKSRVPFEKFYPFFYKIPYKYVFRLLPDKLYYNLLRFIFGGSRKTSDGTESINV